jgi:DNA-binding LacI/PurR family transcriptional regulator/signal transduction histidine kinase/ActR/RegA family two-component response regulator
MMLARRSQPSGNATTFGVLTDWLEGEYQSELVGSLVEAAREFGVNLVLFNSGTLRAPFHFGERHNVAYDLALSHEIDGLVIQAGTLGAHLTLDDLGRYCERYRPRPMCSISVAIEGATGILVDGEQALRDGIRHLVEDHQYRRVAFIGGPEGNNEARDRLRTFREVLAGSGIMPPDSFVAPGDFTYESGVDAVRILLDERGVTFDAIVAANDEMALGAIDALRIRNIRVPRDVAVIGFDDVNEARYCTPPLTTIRQPVRKLGRLAIEILLQRIRGEDGDAVRVVPAELVVRRSCGCLSDARRTAVTGIVPRSPTRPVTDLTVREALRLRRSQILEAMREPVGGLPDGIPDGWEASLLDALVAELQGAPAGFAERFTALLKEMMSPGATGNHWQPALSALHRELMPCLASDPAIRARAEDLLEEARALIGEAVEDSEAQRRLTIERRTERLSQAAEVISAAFDLDSLGKALRECLPRLGFPSAYLVLEAEGPSAGARVVSAYDQGRDPAAVEALCNATIQGTSLPPGLLPLDRAYAMVVEPLFFKDDPLGYAVFEMGPTEASTYESLRARIGGALKVALLIEELQVRADQLRQAQKMETLGQLSGAIAHDFNNLLQAIHGYAELARVDVPGNAELAADLDEIARAADRASELTRQLLTFSQPARANTRVVDVNACVDQAIPMMRHLLGPTIRLSAILRPEAGNILIDPTQLEQVILNLCVNSRDAMPEGGTLTIETGRRLAAPVVSSNASHSDPWALRPRIAQTMTLVAISDTGSGIRPEIRERIFEPFFTTKETGQGSGLGLSIVYGIVHNAGGDIVVESEPGNGTCFSLMFPPCDDPEEASAVEVERPVHGSETVLLVEDEGAIRKLADRVLTDAGYRVLSAANASEARTLWHANQGRIDLLLSDVTMPGLSGLAFAAELADGGKPPRTLFISGHVPGGVGGPAFPRGARLLPKPFSVAALRDAVRAALDSLAV